MSVLLARAGMPGQGRLFAAEGEVVMRRGWKTGYAVLLSVLLGLGGVGCTTQPSVSSPTTPVVVTPSTSTTSVTASSATPTATKDDEAAIAALKAYVEALNQAMKTLDPTEVAKLAGPACAVCERDAETLRRDRAAGRSYTGGVRTLSEIQVVERTDKDHYLLSARITTEAITVRDASGRVVDEFTRSSGPKAFVMSRIAGEWRLDAVSS